MSVGSGMWLRKEICMVRWNGHRKGLIDLYYMPETGWKEERDLPPLEKQDRQRSWEYFFPRCATTVFVRQDVKSQTHAMFETSFLDSSGKRRRPDGGGILIGDDDVGPVEPRSLASPPLWPLEEAGDLERINTGDLYGTSYPYRFVDRDLRTKSAL
ncbi:hypothetical protein P168DRAFT_300911 [Aspergillus campestris IBT 28561]|uniref:Uncharacterized protein n=1 Tax=Aspergillus campestris (strain IBT 28561) TaxID=1392248 RepID=A0A2I1DE68_ASPC2|nr:uncharacterized protein P168DRAFT_300911 [Aspergillus campestris IBT 28561]PKY08154.1 hypothetical protein P168DRAFT_300911 [Aspergillus campestris IBT 28561]